MKRTSLHLPSAIAVLSLTLTAAPAATMVFVADLSGPNENPPVPSLGTGTAVVSYDSSTHVLEVAVDFSDLTGNTTVAHIHCCVDPPGTIGVATFPGTFPGFPVGVTSGSYLGSWDLSEEGSYASGFLTTFGGGTVEGAEAALIEGLSSGRAYVNVHTSFAGAGEIRGFLAPQAIPEPGQALLAVMGIGAATTAVRRRRPGSRKGSRGANHGARSDCGGEPAAR